MVNILLSRSAVFDCMLNQDMKEAQVGEVDILDVDPATLKKMLEFIYTGQVANCIIKMSPLALVYLKKLSNMIFTKGGRRQLHC